MQIQINTDNHINGKEALTTYVESALESALSHFEDRLTRVEVHLGDENAGKHGVDDKRCMLQARPKSHRPLTVSHQAGSVHKAVDGAAGKLKTALETVFGRLDDRVRHAAVDQADVE
jgi:ribosome-associated translation inhibitor RaiA